MNVCLNLLWNWISFSTIIRTNIVNYINWTHFTILGKMANMYGAQSIPIEVISENEINKTTTDSRSFMIAGFVTSELLVFVVVSRCDWNWHCANFLENFRPNFGHSFRNYAKTLQLRAKTTLLYSHHTTRIRCTGMLSSPAFFLYCIALAASLWRIGSPQVPTRILNLR